VRYDERLAELGAVPSLGSVGDSDDNSLAETVNGNYKAELIRGPAHQRPWKTVEDEQAFYASHRDDQQTVEIP
jgi:putative transposase